VKNYEQPSLRDCLTKPKEWFQQFGDVLMDDDKKGQLVFQDNGAKILAVSHLDTVGWSPNPIITKNGISNCRQCDDRLGTWTILSGLKPFNLEIDILLTDFEEIGESTAQYFKSEKQYNWMFEFDRAGVDVVMYNYHTKELSDTLSDKYEFTVGRGSFTDICYLEGLGCKGFNFGTGYHMAHQDKCHAIFKELIGSAGRFRKFYEDYKDIHLPHEEIKETIFTTRYYSKSSCGKNYGRAMGYSQYQDVPWWKEYGEDYVGNYPDKGTEDTPYDNTWEADLDYSDIAGQVVVTCSVCKGEVDEMDRECDHCKCEFTGYTYNNIKSY
jgi:hypothetical protein